MKNLHESNLVEFALGSHGARPGWSVFRVNYNPLNAAHRSQVDAAIGALIRAGHEAVEVQQSDQKEPIAI